jgi:peroxiredoxin
MLMKWKKYYRNLLAVPVFLMINSCINNSDLKIKNAVRHNIGKTIDFSWQKNQILTDTIINDCSISDKPLTIISKVSKTLCPECLGNYLQGADVFVSGFRTDSIQFIGVVSSNDIKAIQAAISNVNPKMVKLIYDVNDDFLEGQSIRQIKGRWDVFLLDRNHKVLLMGDPLTDTNVNALYKKQIKSIIEKEGWLSVDVTK